MTSSATERYTEEFVDVRGTRVRVLSAGEGAPVLYLHGSGDTGGWTPVLTRLATYRRVIRPDHPGFNGSDDDERIDTIQELAFFYVDFLNQLRIDRVSVLGVSLGGWIAAELATIAPTLIDKLVLVGADGLRVEGVQVPDYFVMDPIDVARHTFYDADRQAAAAAEAERLSDDTEALRAYLRRRAATAHLGWNPLLHDPKLPDKLHRVTAPTLLVWGEHDAFSPPAIADRYAELIADARLEVIPEAGHLPHVEQLEAFDSVVAPFLG